MDKEIILILIISYIGFSIVAAFIYDMMDWWDTYRNRYVYIALVFYGIVIPWLLIYYPLMYIYNKLYRIKW